MPKFHIYINIDNEIRRIKKTGKTLFNETPSEALEVLQKAKKEGKTFYSGCSNMTED